MTLDLDAELTAVLGAPMTHAQHAALDERLRTRRARPDARHGHAPVRRIALLAAALFVVASSFAFVSGATRTTEAPNGLASADAFRREIQAAKAVVPIPAGATWPPTLNVTDGDSYSAGGGRSWVESQAFCLWSAAWLDARTRTDVTAERAAAVVIAGIPTSEMYRGTFATQSYRDVLDLVIASVASGRAGPVETFTQVNC